WRVTSARMASARYWPGATETKADIGALPKGGPGSADQMAPRSGAAPGGAELGEQDVAQARLGPGAVEDGLQESPGIGDTPDDVAGGHDVAFLDREQLAGRRHQDVQAPVEGDHALERIRILRVQAGDALDPNGITELGDDRDLSGLDGEEAQGHAPQTEQAETDDRADRALPERRSLLPAVAAPATALIVTGAVRYSRGQGRCPSRG